MEGEQEKRESNEKFDVGVFAFIQVGGRILLVRDATREMKWTMPGGGLGFRELAPDALIRELEEEAQIKVKVTRLVGIFSQQKTPGVTILFDAEIVEGTPTPDGKETSKTKFFSVDEIEAMEKDVKPAQLGMIRQRLMWDGTQPIFNYFS